MVVSVHVYPEHARALKKSKLAPAHNPNLGKLLVINESDGEEKEIMKKKEEGDIHRSRQTFFVLVYHDVGLNQSALS